MIRAPLPEHVGVLGTLLSALHTLTPSHSGDGGLARVRGSEDFSHLPETTQLPTGGAGIWTREVPVPLTTSSGCSLRVGPHTCSLPAPQEDLCHPEPGPRALGG